MTLVTPDQVNPGDEITASSLNTPISQLADAINGELDDDNIDSLSGTKVATGTLPFTALVDEDWTSWTPSFTNLSGGTVNYAKYFQVGRVVFFKFKYTLAGAGVSGSVSMSLPVGFSSDYSGSGTDPIDGNVIYFDNSTSDRYPGFMVYGGTSTLAFSITDTSSSYGRRLPLNSTQPMTWAANDVILGAGWYETS